MNVFSRIRNRFSPIRPKSASFAALACLLLGGFAQTSHAARFANQFTEFELPPGWQCNLEGAEWVCQSTNDGKKKDAIIVLAAKLKGDQDSLDQYLTHLKAAKSYMSAQNKPVKSDPKYAKNATVNSHAWIDALHLESEIPGFYTRYLATVKEDIGVLITYSINKNKYQEYIKDFDSMINTLKVFRKKGPGLNAAPASANLFDQTKIPGGMTESTVFNTAPIQGGAETPVEAPKKSGDMTLLLVAGAAAIAVLLFLKKKRG